MLVTGVLGAMRTEARWMISNGRVTPGAIESEMRHVLGELERLRTAARHEREPCVYFAEREGFVKIGTTIDVPARMAVLAAGGSMLAGMTAGPVTLLATIPGGIAEEKALHRRFRRLRADPKREWFRYEGALRKFVEELMPLAEAV